jgi:hypothetical protein
MGPKTATGINNGGISGETSRGGYVVPVANRFPPRNIAKYFFVLPTVAFFMCKIGVFIIGNVLSTLQGYRTSREPPIWRRTTVAVRYVSYGGSTSSHFDGTRPRSTLYSLKLSESSSSFVSPHKMSGFTTSRRS